MSQEVILNGRTSNIAPDNALVINRPARFEPLVINGLMPTDVTINGLTRPPVLPGCVLNLPLYHSALSNPGSFKSLDAYQHACAVTGALWTPDGRYLDGVDDKITAPDAPSFDLDVVGSATLEAWVKQDNAAGICTIINKKGAGAALPYTFEISSSYVGFRFYNGAWHGKVDTVNILTANAFAHVVVTYDESTLRLYTNAIAGDTSIINVAFPTNDLDLQIGVYTYGGADSGLFKGIIGELRMYKRILTPQEILYNFLATRWRYQ